MVHHRKFVFFRLLILFMLNNVEGQPTSKGVVLDKSVFEAIEKSITQYLKWMSFAPTDENSKKKSDEFSAESSSTSVVTDQNEPRLQYPASSVVYLDDSVQRAINSSIKKKVREFLHKLLTKEMEKLEKPYMLTSQVSPSNPSEGSANSSPQENVEPLIPQEETTSSTDSFPREKSENSSELSEPTQPKLFAPTSSLSTTRINEKWTPSLSVENEKDEATAAKYTSAVESEESKTKVETLTFVQALTAKSIPKPVSNITSHHDKQMPEHKQDSLQKKSKPLYTLVIISRDPKIEVLDKLKASRISLKNFGVLSAHFLPTGSLTLECDSEKGKARLTQTIRRLKPLDVIHDSKKFLSEVRFDVPIDATSEEVSKVIMQSFGERPTQIRFMPVSLRKTIKIAILSVENTLLKKMKATPYVEMGKINSMIDTSVYVTRCGRCQLLGHREKFCRFPPRSYPAPDENCIDCSFYNEYIPQLGLPNCKERDANHITHNINCPTRQYFVEKWTRRQGSTDDVVDKDSIHSDDSSKRSSQKASSEKEEERSPSTLIQTPPSGLKSFAKALQDISVKPIQSKNSTNFRLRNEKEQDNSHSLAIISKIPGKNVLDELKLLNIDLKSYGVKHHHLSSIDNLQVECDSAKGKEELWRMIKKSARLDIHSYSKKKFPYEARVYVPNNVTEDQISTAVFQTYNEYPSNVLFLPIWNKQQQVVLLHVSESLFKSMEESPIFPVGRSKLVRADTQIRVDRCEKCHLLRHRGKFCRSPYDDPPSTDEKCWDCVNYNRNLEERHSETRDENHPTNDDNCPTKLFFINKWKEKRGDNETPENTSKGEHPDSKKDRIHSQQTDDISISNDFLPTLEDTREKPEQNKPIFEQLQRERQKKEHEKLSVSTSGGSNASAKDQNETPKRLSDNLKLNISSSSLLQDESGQKLRWADVEDSP